VWAEFCRREKKAADECWMADVLKYQRDVLVNR